MLYSRTPYYELRTTKKASQPAALLTSAEFLALLGQCRMGRSLREYGRQFGVTGQMMGQVLNGQINPGQAVAAALGYEQVIAFRPTSKDARALLRCVGCGAPLVSISDPGCCRPDGKPRKPRRRKRD